LSKLRKPVTLETAFGTYTVDDLLGEGGAGRVYGGVSHDGAKVAVKVLSADRAASNKRSRFKNEIAFLARDRHPNIVSVTDHGVAKDGDIKGPFYVMRRYDCNLRDLMKLGGPSQDVLQLFGKILDGVEAAHLLGVVHRDLKPENVLFDKSGHTPAIADFGVASFTDDIVATVVETGPTQRLANFMYAAPEQRSPGQRVALQADIYALGLMLNEMFTSKVPHGTDFHLIGKAHPDFAYLDAVVAKMMKQEPTERFDSTSQLKTAIAAHHSEFLSLQKISKIDATVIPAGEVDEPLAHEPPKLVEAEWSNGVLILRLDRPVNEAWVQILQGQMGSFSYSMNAPPQAFRFNGHEARVQSREHEAQSIIDHFKDWLPQASRNLKFLLEGQERQRQVEIQNRLKREREAEEQRLRVNRALRV
jgi:eukaryotic-like serine/threonine-protein kinase